MQISQILSASIIISSLIIVTNDQYYSLLNGSCCVPVQYFRLKRRKIKNNNRDSNTDTNFLNGTNEDFYFHGMKQENKKSTPGEKNS